MPKPGQKSVSLPSELVDEATRTASERGLRSGTELILLAIRQFVDATSEPHAEPPASAVATADLLTTTRGAPAPASSRPAGRRGRQSQSKPDVEAGRDSGSHVRQGDPAHGDPQGSKPDRPDPHETATAKPVPDVPHDAPIPTSVPAEAPTRDNQRGRALPRPTTRERPADSRGEAPGVEAPIEPVRPLETWTPPKVRCERCGKSVETTAAAREAHFRICPP